MSAAEKLSRERTLILAPRGRDAVVAKEILAEAHLRAQICTDLQRLVGELEQGADIAVITEEAIRTADIRPLLAWVVRQPAWSDFPFVVLTGHGGGLERNPAAVELMQNLGNVTFLERPFHPTTLISMVQTGLRGRERQYDCQRLNEELEMRVAERTAELGAANRQLLAQIEEREKVEATLRQMQRLEAVGQLTSGVAHDFNNLLTVVLGNLEFVERGLATAGLGGAMLQRVGYMRSAAERGARLTDQLLAFSRRQRLESRPIDLNGTVTGMRELLQSTMGGSIRITTMLEPDLWLALGDPTQLELAVLNLAINARDAMGGGGDLMVATANVDFERPVWPEDPAPGKYVSICVSDSGSGMTETVRRKAFEPFFTTKEVGKGSGLGLSQVLGFAKQSGGGVRIDTRPGKGTAVRIYLPRSTGMPGEAAAASPTLEPAHAATANILLVDDDQGVREVTAAMLRDLGYEVHEAADGRAALELLAREPKIDLMLIDYAMPGMNGADVARKARPARPTMPTLFITGFADRRALSTVSESHIIGKPFRRSELAHKVRVTLAEAEAGHIAGLSSE
ncbi:MAG TPA: response regulator [Stellaceae bacterium]|nr:response regulator [Stellaceae bacterium]